MQHSHDQQPLEEEEEEEEGFYTLLLQLLSYDSDEESQFSQMG